VPGFAANHRSPALLCPLQFAASSPSHANNRITFDVSTCSGYADRRQASIHEMEEIAWILRSDLKKNSVGFVKASDLKAKDRFVLPDEWS
jgi:hypothetical protein